MQIFKSFEQDSKFKNITTFVQAEFYLNKSEVIFMPLEDLIVYMKKDINKNEYITIIQPYKKASGVEYFTDDATLAEQTFHILTTNHGKFYVCEGAKLEEREWLTLKDKILKFLNKIKKLIKWR